MKILSIETSGSVCAVALTQDDKLIKEYIIDDGNTHSVKLMPLVDSLLNKTNTKISDIDLFACDVGPRIIYRNKDRSIYCKSIYGCN